MSRGRASQPEPAAIASLAAPPIRVVVPGMAYRRDPYDASHAPAFEQIEGLAVDEGITFVDLKATLAEFARRLDERMLVIADRAQAIGLAGIMGGASTEVGERTTRVILESAVFHGPTVRNTARRLGLPTGPTRTFPQPDSVMDELMKRAGYRVTLAEDGLDAMA